MSFDYDYTAKKDKEEYYNELDSSVLKVSAPIGRLKFFINYICYMLIVFAYALTFIRFLSFIVVPFLAYLFFVNYASRLWDIIGDRKIAIIAAIVTLVILACVHSFWGFLFWVLLAFIPGKLIK